MSKETHFDDAFYAQIGIPNYQEQTARYADFDMHGLSLTVTTVSSATATYFPFAEGTKLGAIDFMPIDYDKAQTQVAPRILLKLYDGLTAMFDEIHNNKLEQPDVFYGVTDGVMGRALPRFGFQTEDLSPDQPTLSKKAIVVKGEPALVHQNVRTLGARTTATGENVIERIRKRVQTSS